MSDKFRHFCVTFPSMDDEIDYYSQSEKERRDRLKARALIRGCLMFDDLELADDPWNYDNPKNR